MGMPKKKSDFCISANNKLHDNAKYLFSQAHIAILQVLASLLLMAKI